MAFIYRGDYETGDASQWDGTADGNAYPGNLSGLATVLSTYTCGTGLVVTPAAGSTHVAMTGIGLNVPLAGANPTGSDRAERIKAYDYAGYHLQVRYFTMAWMLDPDTDWASAWSGNATVTHFHPVIGQLLTRNLQAASVLFYLHPTGWEGASAPSISCYAWGGLTVPGVGAEHLLACDPNAGTGWDTLMAPATAGSSGAQRGPQLIGPNTMLAGNRPLTPGVWHLLKWVMLCCTNTGVGWYQAYHKVHGDGQPWVKVLDTSANPIYKTVQYNDQGYGQPPTTSGGNNNMAFGGYCYWLPASIHFFHDCFTISDTDADANSVFDLTDIGVGGSTYPRIPGGCRTAPVAKVGTGGGRL